jgi:hypothetical protein
MHRAFKARPRIEATATAPFKKPDFEDFQLEPVMGALDLIEHSGRSVNEALDAVSGVSSWPGQGRERRPLHPGLARWAAQAVTHYLEARFPPPPELGRATSPVLVPVKELWVEQLDVGKLDEHGVRMYELCAWGRRYETPDGLYRELRLLRLDTAAKEREPGEVAMAARVLARGSTARLVEPGPGPLAWHTTWGRPYQLRAGALPTWVRIVQVGCGDGSVEVLFDNLATEALRLFDEQAKGRLRATVDATERRPGRSCASCRLAPSCAALPKVPGLLGVADATRPRRTVSATDLRRHDKCPAQEHLRRLGLPRRVDVEYGSPHIRRGNAVHALLEQLHARMPHRPCSFADVPDDGEWQAGEWHLTGREAELGARLMARHVAVCPLKYADHDPPPRPEAILVFDDPVADTVVIAQPDLLYHDSGGWVWRETKTTRYIADRSGKDILEAYPQAALAVVVLAEGALGGDLSKARVELEILRPTGPDLELISPSDPGRVAKAREVLCSLVAAWHADRTFTANPGKQCADCEVAQWCPSATRVLPDTGDAPPDDQDGGQAPALPSPSAQSTAA